MKRIRILFLSLILVLAIFLPACKPSGGDGYNYNEPPTNGTVKWNSDLPSIEFSKRADVLDACPLYDSDEHDFNITYNSLMAIINAEKPRIVLLEGGINSGRKIFDNLNYNLNIINTPIEVFKKYSEYIKKVVVYDKNSPDTLNLAATYAGINQAIVVSQDALQELQRNDINPTIAEDYRGKFSPYELVDKGKSQRLEVYQYMLDNLFNQATHNIIGGLTADLTMGMRDYTMASKACVIALGYDDDEQEIELQNKFLAKMRHGNAVYMGWHPQGHEGTFVNSAAQHGMFVWASDHSKNLTVLKEARQDVPIVAQEQKGVSEFLDSSGKVKPAVYVGIGMTDGDNLQYLAGAMMDLWNNPLHDDPNLPPITWSYSPSACDTLPTIHDYYFNSQRTKYTKDSFMSGPTGIGYFYPIQMYNKSEQLTKDMLNIFSLTNTYSKKMGIVSIGGGFRGVQDPTVPLDFIKLVAPKIPDMKTLTWSNNQKLEVVDGIGVRGWQDPYNESPVDNFKGQVFKGFSDFTFGDNAPGDKATFVTLNAVPWFKQTDQFGGGILDFLRYLKGDYSANLEEGAFKGAECIKFINVDQVLALEKISKGLPY